MKTKFTFSSFLKTVVFAQFLCYLTLALNAQTRYDVNVSNYEFSPSALTIEVGDTVVWTNTEGSHNVNGTQATFASNPESFGNEVAAAEWSYSHVFTVAGSYDYQCDPHASGGMTGTITVNEAATNGNMLTINFTGMTPHVGQMLKLAVINQSTGMELVRTSETVTEEFSVELNGIEDGQSYFVDFYADHNENGTYDAPPIDHAWRLTLDNANGNEVLDFAHNTDFTDIMWKNKLTINFMAMTPHVGQTLKLAVIDQSTGMEAIRTSLTVEEEFMVYVTGLKDGESYDIDFFVDFNENGMYDAPNTDHAWRIELNDVMGDTTITFTHNTDFTDIMWMNKLTVDFMDMDPHVGQMLTLYLKDLEAGEYIDTVEIADITADFSVSSYKIEVGKSYEVDFFVDFNENGMYDAPPTDHAWRLPLNDVMGDTTITFTHNTDFTDIMMSTMENTLTINFSSMTPHVGQMLMLSVVDQNSEMEVARTSATVEEEFSLEVMGIEVGESYKVDFFVDFNENGMYDAPNTDHAWRIELNDVMGDTTVTFTHNTDFTDIMWMNKLTVDFMDMDPHVGQMLTLYLKDLEAGEYVDTVEMADITADFSVSSYKIEVGKSYEVDFFVDFNENGMYDAPPTDHAWRLPLDNVLGDTTITFTHNTDFTDIMMSPMENTLTINFSSMTPHVGQMLMLSVIDQNSEMEVARTSTTVEEEFSLEVMGIEVGESYNVDFFVDFNENGMYDAPNTDHAWRIELNDVMGDTTITFTHNTDFTDIMWMNKLTVDFMDMNPHVGQMLTLYLKDLEAGEYIDTVEMADITADFSVSSYKIEVGKSYEIDFFADHNGNGVYDTPPTDHAWRLPLNDVMGDTTVVFTHNTNFTDISIATNAEDLLSGNFDLIVYPNPTANQIYISAKDLKLANSQITFYNSLGSKVQTEPVYIDSNRLRYNVQHLRQGLYFVKVQNDSFERVMKFIKQ